jgi:prolyl oligopeptidase
VSDPAASANASRVPARLDYPAAPREDVVDVLHGVPVPDPYRWLEDAGSPRTKDWVAAEDGLTRAFLARLPDRAPIAARLKELLYVEQVVGLPVKRGGRLFYQRRAPTQEKAVLCWRQGDGPEKVLLDPNDWSKDGSRSLGRWSPSWDGRSVAFQVKENNSDEAVLQLVDVDTGNGSAVDRIEGAKYASPSWTPDSRGFYYTWLPTDATIPVAERPGFAEVRFHRVGTAAKDDPTVFPRTGDPRTFVSGEVSRDGRWIVVTKRFGWTSSDVFFREARADGPWRPLVEGRKAQFDVTPWRDRFYVRTNDGAPMGKVMAADPAAPDPARWATVVPERPDAALEGMDVVGGRLGLNYTSKASSRLAIREVDGTGGYEVALPGPGTVEGPAGDPEEAEAFYAFQSFTDPREIRSLDVPTGATRTWYRTRVPVDPAPYLVEQVFYPSKDGTRVSMFVVRRRDRQLDGSAPLWLTGYGGFQVPMLPAFMGSVYPWLERGGIFAMPNLRGGSEYGERWHEEGMLLRKQNVFDDFVAAAEWLIAHGYTRPERLAISGGSNGGLLVGAAMAQRPELFRVVVCAVPLLDMVRYHLFGSGKTWISEYGSAADPEQFRALRAYSPYHHLVRGTRYPATLLLTADADDRVDPLHARKFAAALQWASTGGPVLLRVERQAGHGGADLVRQKVEEIADEYAFALDQIHRGAAR